MFKNCSAKKRKRSKAAEKILQRGKKNFGALIEEVLWLLILFHTICAQILLSNFHTCHFSLSCILFLNLLDCVKYVRTFPLYSINIWYKLWLSLELVSLEILCNSFRTNLIRARWENYLFRCAMCLIFLIVSRDRIFRFFLIKRHNNSRFSVIKWYTYGCLYSSRVNFKNQKYIKIISS